MYMQVSERKHRQVAALAVLLFLIALVLFFFLVKLREYNPPLFEKPPVEVEIEMEVMAGGSQGGSSVQSEVTPTPTPQPNPTPNPQTTPPTHVDTQPQPSDPTPSSEQETQNNQQSQPQTNPLAVFRPSGNGNTGTGTGQGDGQGSQSGTGDGTGNGPGSGAYELAGRSLLTKPTLNCPNNETGTIALNIYVDQNGNVVNATYNRTKSSIQNKTMEDCCVRTAKSQIKFDAKPGAPVEQRGVYYFRFVKN